jgi:hypothetical protein
MGDRVITTGEYGLSVQSANRGGGSILHLRKEQALQGVVISAMPYLGVAIGSRRVDGMRLMARLVAIFISCYRPMISFIQWLIRMVMFTSIAWLWQNTLEDAFTRGKSSIIKITSAMITELKILNYYLILAIGNSRD